MLVSFEFEYGCCRCYVTDTESTDEHTEITDNEEHTEKFSADSAVRVFSFLALHPTMAGSWPGFLLSSSVFVLKLVRI